MRKQQLKGPHSKEFKSNNSTSTRIMTRSKRGQHFLLLDEDVFEAWCAVQQKLKLLSHSQTATFLINNFQATTEAERENGGPCNLCGVSLCWTCPSCLVRQHQQSTPEKTTAKRRPGRPRKDTALESEFEVTKRVHSSAEQQQSVTEHGESRHSPASGPEPSRKRTLGSDLASFSEKDNHGNKRKQASSDRRQQLFDDDDSDDDNNEQVHFELPSFLEDSPSFPTPVVNQTEAAGSNQTASRDQILTNSRPKRRTKKSTRLDDDQSMGGEGGATANLACPVCQKVFQRKRTWLNHKSSCKQIFVCGVCKSGRKYTTPHCLKRHSQVHTGFRPFACGYCGADFSDSGILHTHHRETHANLPVDIVKMPEPAQWKCVYEKQGTVTTLFVHRTDATTDDQTNVSQTLAENALRNLPAFVAQDENQGATERPVSRSHLTDVKPLLGQVSVVVPLMQAGVSDGEVLCSASSENVTVKMETETEGVVEDYDAGYAGTQGKGVVKEFDDDDYDDDDDVQPVFVETATTAMLADDVTASAILEPALNSVGMGSAKNGRGPQSGAASKTNSQGSPDSQDRVSLRTNLYGKVKKHECPVCHKMFPTPSVLHLHKKTHDASREKDHQCEKCGKFYLSAHSLRSHRVVCLNLKPAVCEVCGKRFASSGALSQHSYRHTGVRKFQCEVCGHGCISAARLKEHIAARHNDNKSCACEQCGKLFHSFAMVKVHQRAVHTSERAFTCNVCLKSFKTNNTMEQHKLSHNLDKNFQCDICQKAFNRRKLLGDHKKRVHGERVFECGVCSRKFKTKHNLRIHNMQHTGERPNVCPICGMTFLPNGNLKKHLKTHKKRGELCDSND